MTTPTIDRLEGVRPFVEIAVGSSYTDAAAGQWDVDLWDDPGATWAGDQPMWLDVTCNVMDVTTRAGRERVIDKWEVGTATVTCNNADGWADFPTSIADLADDDTLLSIRPGRPIRIGVQVYGREATTLWAGYIDAANPSYSPDEVDTMTFECVDAKGDAGRVDLAKLAAPAGASETVSARVNRILTAGGWPTYRRVIDGSGVALKATSLGGKTIDLLDRAAESTGGAVYGDLGADGRDPAVVFRARDWIDYPASSPPAGTIGNAGYQGAPGSWTGPDLDEDPDGSSLYDPAPAAIDEDPDGSGLYQVTTPGYAAIEDPAGTGLYLIATGYIDAVPPDTCPNSWELSFARADITTVALIGRQGETEHVYTDVQGKALFGVEPWTRRDNETDVQADMDWLGARILAARSWKGMPRVAAVTVTADARHPETVATLCAASPYTPARFRCQHVKPGSGDVLFNRIMFVAGVEHSLTPDQWQARIALDDAAPFLIGGAQPALWDQVDVALWDAATWANPT
jgi:hypothetical protein